MKIKRFYCSIEGCNKSFRSEDRLESHQQSHTMKEETEEEKYLFECDVCSQKFPTKRSVSAHRRIHKTDPNHVVSVKVIKFLSKRLAENLQTTESIAENFFTDQDLVLPELTGPQETTLPLLEEVEKRLER